jgi:methionyl-tRNA formyltransferase
MDKIFLIGEGPTAPAALESLAECFEISAIFRKIVTEEDFIARFANHHAIPLIRETTIRRIASEITQQGPSCVVVSSYNRLIPPDLLANTPFVNVHYSPLPRYRGRANVNWAILNGESEVAITIHTIDPGLDSGQILFQRFIPVSPSATVSDLYLQLNQIQREELGKVVTRRLSGYLGTPQRGIPTYCCARLPEDGEIDWTASTRDIDALIRALAPPYPGAFTFFRLQRLWIRRAEPVATARTYAGRIPGRIVAIEEEPGAVDVLTGDGILRLYELETDSGIRSAGSEFVHSTKDTLGLFPRDLLSKIHELEATIAELKERSEQQLNAQLRVCSG